MRRVIALIRERDREDDWRQSAAFIKARLRAEAEVVRIGSPYDGADGEQCITADFIHIGRILDRALDGGGDVTVIVDHASTEELNPLRPPAWETLLARLVLAYPEVHWLFSRVAGNDENSFRTRFGMGNLFHASHNPIFDPAGLRDFVRGKASSSTETKRDARYLPRRAERAVALDEEVPYATLHAYAAYRFGYCVETLTILGTTELSLSARRSTRDSTPPSLIFEDIFVSFPDASGPGLSKLYADGGDQSDTEFKGRAQEWPVLEQAKHRIFVTSGQRSPQDALRWMRNRKYIASQKARGVYTRTLYKPYAGIYRLWAGAGLNQELRWTDKSSGRRFRGVAEGYVWPPDRRKWSGDGSGHSSPGALLQIADHLTARAEKLWDELDRSGSVEEAVRGAVLATDALELLGCRTPTQSIEALRLKHKFELLAECQFSGVEHHVCIKERIAEIRRDIKAISYWFGPRKRKMATWNAEAQILTDLVRILREHGHFDEEQYCMTNIRRAMRKIWLHEKRPWSLMGYPLRWYVEILLDRPVYFVGALTFWTTALFWFFMHHGHQKAGGGGSVTEHGWEASLAETMTTFFQTQTPDGIGWPALLVSSAAILFGFVHLGIFISHLYTQVSRR